MLQQPLLKNFRLNAHMLKGLSDHDVQTEEKACVAATPAATMPSMYGRDIFTATIHGMQIKYMVCFLHLLKMAQQLRQVISTLHWFWLHKKQQQGNVDKVHG